MLAVENAVLHGFFEYGLRTLCGVAGLQVHDLLLQTVPGELNDEFITSDAMRRKLAHGIGQVLQKCCP